MPKVKKSVRDEPGVAAAEDPAAENLPAGPSFEDLEHAPPETPPEPAADEPAIHDPGWTEFVLSRLTDSEKANGKPKVAGLRRVAAELLGPIVENNPDVLQPPCPANGFCAVVKNTLIILWNKGVPEGDVGLECRFAGVADCYPGNTPDARFARFATAVAETRAEGRSLRKALHLDTVTAEEVTELSVDDACLDGMIAPTQANFIDLKCSQLDIDLKKFINAGKGKYSSLREVPYPVADKMIERLSSWQQNKNNIPAELRGYNPGWRDENDG